MTSPPIIPSRSQTILDRVLLVWLSAVFIIAVYFRCHLVDKAPGIHGDEAWYAAEMQSALAGRPYTLVTPSGVIVSPFQSLPELVLVAITDQRSAWLLRLPAILSGIATPLLAFVLFRRLIGLFASLMMALLLASLPILIAYSRLGFDPSHTPFACVLCLAAVTSKSIRWTALAFALCLWVYPSNIFLLPMLAGIVYGQAAESAKGADERRAKRLLVGQLVALFSVATGFYFFVHPRWPLPAGWELSWWLDRKQWLDFFALVGRLFHGTTVYTHLVETPPPGRFVIGDVGFWGVAAPIAVCGVWKAARERRWSMLGLASGLFVSLIAFDFIAGAQSISPGAERFALFLIVPACYVAAVFLDLLTATPFRRRTVAAVVALIASILLADFHEHYFRPLRETGGNSNLAFRTGPVEPKVWALRRINSEVRDVGWHATEKAKLAAEQRPIVIVAEDWLLFNVMRYLAGADRRIQVVRKEMEADLIEKWDARFFYVEWNEPRPPSEQISTKGFSTSDNAGRTVVYVWR